MEPKEPEGANDVQHIGQSGGQKGGFRFGESAACGRPQSLCGSLLFLARQQLIVRPPTWTFGLSTSSAQVAARLLRKHAQPAERSPNGQPAS